MAARLHEKLIKVGAKVVSRGRYVTFQMVEVAMSRRMFANILSLIACGHRLPQHEGRSGHVWQATRGENASIRANLRVSAPACRQPPVSIGLCSKATANCRCSRRSKARSSPRNRTGIRRMSDQIAYRKCRRPGRRIVHRRRPRSGYADGSPNAIAPGPGAMICNRKFSREECHEPDTP